MPFKPNALPKISPLGWMLGISCAANVLTAIAALYVLFGTPTVAVDYGTIDVTSGRNLRIDNRAPLQVQIVK